MVMMRDRMKRLTCWKLSRLETGEGLGPEAS